MNPEHSKISHYTWPMRHVCEFKIKYYIYMYWLFPWSLLNWNSLTGLKARPSSAQIQLLQHCSTCTSSDSLLWVPTKKDGVSPGLVAPFLAVTQIHSSIWTGMSFVTVMMFLISKFASGLLQSSFKVLLTGLYQFSRILYFLAHDVQAHSVFPLSQGPGVSQFPKESWFLSEENGI
jgi:hypothetical protein